MTLFESVIAASSSLTCLSIMFHIFGKKIVIVKKDESELLQGLRKQLVNHERTKESLQWYQNAYQECKHDSIKYKELKKEHSKLEVRIKKIVAQMQKQHNDEYSRCKS